MTNFTFETQGTITYMVYAIQPDDIIDSMSLGMLTNNAIPGLASTIYTQMDATRYIKYNVSSRVPVSQFFMGAVNRKRLLGVFSGIADAMLSAEEYMIDPGTILVDLDYIFADVSTCDTVMVCLPVQSETGQADLGAFFKNIMFNTQFDQTENCDYVAKIINYLNSTPTFSLDEFKDLLKGMSGTAAVSAAPQNQRQQYQSVPPKTQPAVQTQPAVPAQTVVTQQNAMSAAQQQTPPQVRPQAQQTRTQPRVSQTQAAQPFAVPQTQSAVSPAQGSAQPENEMKLSYLLQHYNKENAAAYKAQKAAKKAGQPQAQAPAKPQKEKKAKKAGAPAAAPTSAGFAIPGQQTGVSAPKGSFAIPGSPAQAATQIQTPQPQVPASQPPVQTAPPQSVNYQKAVSVQQVKGNFGETTVLGSNISNDTTVLNADMLKQQAISPYLIRIKNNERILVNKPVFRIGKEKSYVDYFIGDNTAVSRSHANIITRDGHYYAMDTNSTNHTYIDGEMIQSNIEVEIIHGSKVRLANEDFEFRLY